MGGYRGADDAGGDNDDDDQYNYDDDDDDDNDDNDVGDDRDYDGDDDNSHNHLNTIGSGSPDDDEEDDEGEMSFDNETQKKRRRTLNQKQNVLLGRLLKLQLAHEREERKNQILKKFQNIVKTSLKGAKRNVQVNRKKTPRNARNRKVLPFTEHVNESNKNPQYSLNNKKNSSIIRMGKNGEGNAATAAAAANSPGANDIEPDYDDDDDGDNDDDDGDGAEVDSDNDDFVNILYNKLKSAPDISLARIRDIEKDLMVDELPPTNPREDPYSMFEKAESLAQPKISISETKLNTLKEHYRNSLYLQTLIKYLIPHIKIENKQSK